MSLSFQIKVYPRLMMYNLLLLPITAAAMLKSSNPTLHFKSNSNHQTYAPPKNMRNTSQPIPTNAWWGNLIHVDPAVPASTMVQPVWANPFALQIKTSSGVHISYSSDHRGFGPPSANPNGTRYYLHGFLSDMVLSSTESDSFEMKVDQWDHLGVDISLEYPSGGKMTSYLANGMAYVTSRYENLSPVISTVHSIVSINNQVPVESYQLSKDSNLLLELENGQYWMVFSDSEIELKYAEKEFTASVKNWNGTIRIARVELDSVSDFTRFASCIVTGSDLLLENGKTYGWTFKTTGDCTNGVLHYALHHHLDSIDMNLVSRIEKVSAEAATRGPMYGFAGLEWKFHEPKDINVRFYPERSIDPADVSKYGILSHLKTELQEPWVLPKDGSYYFSGKKMQLYASLCLMANDIKVTDYERETLRSQCLDKLKSVWETFLDQNLNHPLVYDEVYGGIISPEAFSGYMWADFGNTMYNDHHYHYGYWITAAAIFRYLDPTWERHPELETVIELLIRDCANPSANDPYFPLFRHFDWYLGHSYSHGITAFADGKDQESTSEDINLDYGMMLWGAATGNKELEELGELMLKVNARAIQLYFLMTDDNPIHPEGIKRNKVTGIFFDNKVDYATWFSPARHCIHGIQMLPISPVNGLVRSQEFVQEEWDQVLSKVNIIQDSTQRDPWQSLLYSNYALVNRQEALKHLAYVPMDDGITRSWALYMAATRS